jgi:hypothetical protein
MLALKLPKVTASDFGDFLSQFTLSCFSAEQGLPAFQWAPTMATRFVIGNIGQKPLPERKNNDYAISIAPRLYPDGRFRQRKVCRR